jgi:hypothetical protein
LTASAYDELVIESNTTAGISQLSRNTGDGGYVFGDQDDSFVAGLLYDHATDILNLMANNDNRLTIIPSGNVGIASTTPWRTLSVTGTVGFDGLTGSTGAGSLCLDSNKQVVYNSASDACLSSTRATKHDIDPLVVDALEQVLALEPVSFVYNEGNGRTRYGFIAEDTANVDAHLATYDASGTVSGIDDRAILSIVVSAIKELWAKVGALTQNDDKQDAEIEELKTRVSELEAAAAGAPFSASEAPSGSSASASDTDATSTTTPSDIVSTPANDNWISDLDSEPSPADDVVDQELLVDEIPQAANDNLPPAQLLPATGTE